MHAPRGHTATSSSYFPKFLLNFLKDKGYRAKQWKKKAAWMMILEQITSIHRLQCLIAPSLFSPQECIGMYHFQQLVIESQYGKKKNRQPSSAQILTLRKLPTEYRICISPWLKTEMLPLTTPTLLWVTDPHLYLGVVTDAFTLTLSPILMCEWELWGGKPVNLLIISLEHIYL